MHRRLKAVTLLLATALLSSCNPFKTDLKTALVGRWESPMWSRGKTPFFAQFTPDGKVEFLGSYGTDYGTWLVLDSGELQITASAETRRCAATLSGNTLTLKPPTCMTGWTDVGPSIELAKQ